MQMLTKAYILANKAKVLKELIDGKIFVYPTDTIYGVGCNALNSESVAKIRNMKKRETKPFSVIAPNIEWIYENCEVNQTSKQWVSKLPGPYTLILPLKISGSISSEVNNSLSTLGVRIPNHWFCDLIRETKLPFVTTSANISGMPNMTDFYDLDFNIKQSVDYIVLDGSLHDKPSTIVDLTEGKEKIIER